MSLVSTLAGGVLILLGLRDMFHSLLHPTSQGTLGQTVQRGTWRLSRATGHRLGGIVGPGGMVVTILLWVVLQTVGWALVYLPHVPEGFSYSPGTDPARYSAFDEAVYISLVGLATLALRDAALRSPSPEVVLEGRRLGVALEQVAQTLREDFDCRGGTVREVLDAYARDHGHAPRTG